MKLNLIPDAPNSITAINQVAQKIEPLASTVKEAPNLSMSPAQINRTYEISKDPPVTVLKYTNTTTKEVELQIPSQVSLEVYKATQEFIKQQEEKKNFVSIKV